MGGLLRSQFQRLDRRMCKSFCESAYMIHEHGSLSGTSAMCLGQGFFSMDLTPGKLACGLSGSTSHSAKGMARWSCDHPRETQDKTWLDGGVDVLGQARRGTRTEQIECARVRSCRLYIWFV